MHTPIQKLSLLIYEVLASLRSPRCWLPLLYFWIIVALGLLALTRFAELPFAGRTADLVARLYGEEALEYPRLYLLLPDMQRKLYLLLATSLGLFFQGAAMLHLFRSHSHGSLDWRQPWRRSFARLPGHFVINIIGLTLILLPLLGFRYGLKPLLEGGGATRGLGLAAQALGILAQIFLIYAAPLYLAFRSRVMEALSASIDFARRNFWVSAGFVLIPYFLAIVVNVPLKSPRYIVEHFSPELVFWLLLVTSFATVIILYLQLSAVIRFYSDEMLRRPFEGEWDDKPVHD